MDKGNVTKIKLTETEYKYPCYKTEDGTCKNDGKQSSKDSLICRSSGK